MITLEQALEQTGELLKQAMIDQLKANGSYDSGRLANSIEYAVRENGDNYQLVRTMLLYGKFVDQGDGRRPGKMPPVSDLIDWIKFKNITVPTGMTVESFAFVIARKIGRTGTHPKPRPFIAPSISKVMRDSADRLIGQGATDEIIMAVNEQLQSISIKA